MPNHRRNGSRLYALCLQPGSHEAAEEAEIRRAEDWKIGDGLFLVQRARANPCGGEAVFLIGDTIELRDAAGLKPRDLQRARALAETHKELIVATWHEWFD